MSSTSPSSMSTFSMMSRMSQFVPMAGKDDGAVSFAHEPAARFRADHAHPAGDQNFHAFS